MAPFKGFISGSYQSSVLQADAERSENFYPERVESLDGQGKTDLLLRAKPGLANFAFVTSASSMRTECALNGRAFAISQTGAVNTFLEVLVNGSTIAFGTLPGDRRPQIVPGNTQLLILAGGLGYTFDLRTSTLTRITDVNFPIGATKGGFLDGYFIVLEPDSQVFALSNLNDGTVWDALDFGDAEGEPGNVVTFLVDHRQVWFLCNTHSEIYINSGDADFPIVRLNGAFMEQGACAIDGAFSCDNTIFWLGGNRDGQGIFWRANGYTPLRISTSAVETAVAKWGDLSAVSGYAYQEAGHTFARWDCPTANNGLGASILFDLSTGFWHDRTFWNATLGLGIADLARCHMYVFGKHLVGDYRSGTIYEQSMSYTTDAGAVIRSLRQSADIANGGQWTAYRELRLLMEVGVGLDSAGFTAPTMQSSGIAQPLLVPAIPSYFQINWEDQLGGGDGSFGNGYNEVYFDGAGNATIRYLGKDVGTIQINEYGFNGVDLVGESTGPGPVSLGSGFVAGQAVVIQCFPNNDHNPAHTWVTGPAANNPDGFPHARLLGPYFAPAVAFVPDSQSTTLGFLVPAPIPAGGAPAAGDGTDPLIALQVSNDGGRTWSSERPVAMGARGDYRRLVRWNRLGNSDNRAFRAICSAPVRVALLAADLDTG